MSYREYIKYMKDNRLIESPESVQDLVNAIRVNDNIKRVKTVSTKNINWYDQYSLKPTELLDQFQKDKDFYIHQAIKKAYSYDWAKEKFEPIELYQAQINELKMNMQSTVAAIGLIDIKRQMGVE